jgi:mRNA interferase MazF
VTGVHFGAVVLTDFPFTDLTAAKRRPALVISTDNDQRTDVIVAYIASIPRNYPDAMAIAPTAGTGLKVKSSVRFDKIATINKNIIAGRIGNADPPGSTKHARCSSEYSGSAARSAKAQ